MKKLIILVSLLVAFPCAASFDNNLYYGMSGSSEVTELQEFLTTEGVYEGPITGNFYSLTLQGVKNFQTREAITPVSGYFGPLSRGAANKILSSQVAIDESGVAFSATTTPPATTADVVATLTAQIKLLMDQIAELQKQTIALQNIQIAQQEQAETLGKIEQNIAPAPAPAPAPVPEVKKEITIDTSGNSIYVYYWEDGVKKSNDSITISSDDNGVFIGQGPEYSCSGGEAANSSGSQRKGNPLTCSTSRFLGNAPFYFSPSATGTITVTATANGVSATATIRGK